MAQDNRPDIAVHRFGLGPRPGEISAIAREPQPWVQRQVAALPPLPRSLSSFPSSLEVLRRKRARDSYAAVERQEADENGAWMAAAVASDTPFFDRWLRFWTNHFAVSLADPDVTGFTGSYVREAIRPHALGNFLDMLRAVARHPAMLIYLDQAESVGPNSYYGQRSGRGLNENLAREILELHCLGVDGGYSQRDVTEFAKILTGWSYDPDADREDGVFAWRPDWHQPGEKHLLGKTYGSGRTAHGQEEGEAALVDIAAHPSTARFIATKLARHFVADDPPYGTVSNLENAFRRSNGDLKAVAQALAADIGAWQAPLTKIRSHQDYLISLLRATGVSASGSEITGWLSTLGQSPFRAPAPTGWPDRAESWIAPEAVLRRLDLASTIASRCPGGLNAETLGQEMLGGRLSARTKAQIRGAESPAQALTLLFASPEFQRR
jgi:uncharacterized protein (DUF1800 family)